MALPFEDDDDRLAQLQTLGEQFRVDGRIIYGILNRDYAPADVGEHSVESDMPILMVRTVDVPDLPMGTEVEAIEEDGSWVVAFPPEPDGTGMTRLRLNET